MCHRERPSREGHGELVTNFHPELFDTLQKPPKPHRRQTGNRVLRPAADSLWMPPPFGDRRAPHILSPLPPPPDFWGAPPLLVMGPPPIFGSAPRRFDFGCVYFFR